MTHNTIDEKLRREFTSWHTAETTFAYGVPSNMNTADWWLEKLHHQLQKARQDWLREEIVKLEGMKFKDYPIESLMKSCSVKGQNEALQTIIDRYHSELDQPTENKRYCNGEPCTCHSELDQDKK